MSNKMEEEQLSFLGELLGDSPADVETKVDEAEPVNFEQVGDGEPDEVDEQQEPAKQEDVSQEGEQDAPDSVAILREQIVKLTEQLSRDPLQQAVQEDITNKGQQTDVEKKQAKLENFLTAEELDRVIDEPDVLNKAFGRAISVMEQNIQSVIQAEVNRQILVSKAVSEFYTTNQDLAPYGKFVQFVMSEIEQQNQDKTYAEIFQMTAEKARERLGLGGNTRVDERQKSQTNAQRPAFAGSKKSTARPAGKQEFFDPNAADMMNSL